MTPPLGRPFRSGEPTTSESDAVLALKGQAIPEGEVLTRLVDPVNVRSRSEPSQATSLIADHSSPSSTRPNARPTGCSIQHPMNGPGEEVRGLVCLNVTDDHAAPEVPIDFLQRAA
jgi:hypothetical protein